MNKLRDVFCHNKDVAERTIKKIVNQAYNMQWCSSCEYSEYIEDDTGSITTCRISEELCKKRGNNEQQFCLFYKAKNRGE